MEKADRRLLFTVRRVASMWMVIAARLWKWQKIWTIWESQGEMQIKMATWI